MDIIGYHPVYIWLLVVPVAVAAGLLLLYIIFEPFIKGNKVSARRVPHINEVVVNALTDSFVYKEIAIALDFSKTDSKSISSALQMGGYEANYTLIHIVETVGAMVYGDQAHDYETSSDKEYLNKYKVALEAMGYKVNTKLNFGSPKKQIPLIINDAGNFDILILGAHGHNWFKDIVLGTTVDAVRHKIKIPLLIIKDRD
jgi:manganese transport protein